MEQFARPIEAKVNTGVRAHKDWKNGETVWILCLEQRICGVAHDPKRTKPEGHLRLEVLQVEDEDGREELEAALRKEAAARARAS